MSVVQDFKDLPAPAKQLLLARGVTSFGSGLVLPLLVIYLVQGRGFGISLATGAMALTSVTAFVGGLVAGWAADRFGGVRAACTALLLAAVGTGMYAWVTAPWQALAAAAVFGLGVGGTSVWYGLLAEAVEADRHPVVFGFHFGVANAALGVGGILAGIAVSVERLWTFQAVYLADAVTFVLAAVVTVVAGRSLPTARDRAQEGGRKSSYVRVLANGPLLAVLLIGFLMFSIGYSQLESGIPAVLVAVSDVRTSDIALMCLADTAFAVIAQIALMPVVKRTPHRVSLAIAALTWMVFWVVLLGALQSGSRVVLLTSICAGVAVASVGAAFYSMAMPTLVNAAATSADRGRANALLGISTSLGFTAGPFAAGLFADHGMARVWVFVAAATAATTALLARVLRLPATARPEEPGQSEEPEQSEEPGRSERPAEPRLQSEAV
ncbi:MFS transporter [Streptomyces sp. NRRL F-4474]|uniref:MFS transporter n=1 Tax=Streptomyces sp. NRRL F-4474 TaxID=1463851 RepID=UPI0004C73E57|nr:MFS transporter [Streptomyces sp. NRRL F-4474]